MEFDLSGTPEECRAELTAALANVFEAVRPYGECSSNGFSHLLMVTIPAVEKALIGAIIDYDDGELFVRWATSCRSVQKRPAVNPRLFGQGWDGQIVVEAWHGPVKRIAEQMAEFWRPLSSLAAEEAS